MKPGGYKPTPVSAAKPARAAGPVKPGAFEGRMNAHKSAIKKLKGLTKQIYKYHLGMGSKPSIPYSGSCGTTGGRVQISLKTTTPPFTSAERDALKDLGYTVDQYGNATVGIAYPGTPYAPNVKMLTGAGTTPTDKMIKKMQTHSHSKMRVAGSKHNLGQLLQKHLGLTGVIDSAGFQMGQSSITRKVFDARLKKLLRAGYRPFDAARKNKALAKLRQLKAGGKINQAEYQALSSYVHATSLMVPRNCRGY